MTGVGLLTDPSTVGLSSAAGVGELAMIGTSACYGFAFACVRRYVRGDPVANVTAQLLTGTVIITPVAVATGVAYILHYLLIAEIGATAASFVTYLIPVVGVALGWVFLGERRGLSGFLGMALVIAGVAVSCGWHRGLRHHV